MAKRVDTGSIIAVKRFPVYASDDVASLLARTYDFQLVLFYEVLSHVIEGRQLPVSDENWTREAITRKEFNRLGRITPDMSADEICRRVRAISFGPWKPTVEIEGYVFELKAPPPQPNASEAGALNSNHKQPDNTK
jgi:methionyl-tRNA formyltransferase